MPLWGRFENGSSQPSYRSVDQSRPSILRFASDDFMQQMLSILETDPRQMGRLIARPETWRSETAEAPDLVERVPLPRLARTLARSRAGKSTSVSLAATAHSLSTTENGVAREVNLKLYQPAHQRHYLVAANLVCGIAGFPDRAIATGDREKVGFVLRRLLLPAGATSETSREEYAFIKNESGAGWQRVPSGSSEGVIDGEELLPLFPLNFADDTKHPRRLFAGLVPVGRREEYMSTAARAVAASGAAGATSASTDGAATAVSARKEQLKVEVIEPWKNLVRSASAALDTILNSTTASVSERRAAALAANERLQGQSWLLLLDFADYLSVHVPRVWEGVVDDARKPAPGTAARALFDWLNTAEPAPGNEWQLNGSSFTTSLRSALKKVHGNRAWRDALEGAVQSYPDAPGGGFPAWPDFLYLLAGIRETAGVFKVAGRFTSLDAPVEASLTTIEREAGRLDKLVQMVVAAVDAATPGSPAAPVPFAVRLRDALGTTQGDAGWFVIRCAYVRCDCGPLQPTVLSAPSQRFQLASFFDPDAPARPIRISLPMDTTPAGMRKFNKNTAFVMSDVLCGQVQRAKGLGLVDLVLSVLPFPFHKPLDVGGMGPCSSNGNAIGMICSISIPIITICALIVLMIMVTLLDLIFKWIPWFIMCFPVPGLKAKR
jgi:hypothetical protein